MEIEKLEYDLTVCKVSDASSFDLTKDFYFIGRTDEEFSLVCRTEETPAETIEREDGWKGFRIRGVLDFSLIGILSRLSRILVENNIGIFAVSTYNTDYILVKAEDFAPIINDLEFKIMIPFVQDELQLSQESALRLEKYEKIRSLGHADVNKIINELIQREEEYE